LATVASEAGVLYGTTSAGSDGYGAVYQLAPPVVAGGTWTAANIHSFGPIPDGGGPEASLTVGQDAVFYGTTLCGGSAQPLCAIPGASGGCDTVFQLTPPTAPGGPWTETVLYSFMRQNGDGAFPFGPVVLAPNGILYGTSGYGGNAGSCNFYFATGCGTVFQLTPPAAPGGAWTETMLHNFSGENGDGAAPIGALALDSNGVLYGTTFFGGSADLGTVFAITP
jgi:uncharacterized repeat protein (TIGR03803 family)